MPKIHSSINFSNLPDEAVDEVLLFYNYLIHKHKMEKKKISEVSILYEMRK